MIVALDTMVLIWGVRQGGDAAIRALQERSKILLRQLEDERAQIIVPSIAVAELLVPVAQERHGRFINELQKRFICPPFDVQAASIAAQLWQVNRKDRPVDQLNRSTLKADIQIIATARAAGATRFYSADKKCRRLARQLGLDGRDLPTHHENLFVDKESSGSKQRMAVRNGR